MTSFTNEVGEQPDGQPLGGREGRKKKKLAICELFRGADGTRTRDLLRDRQAL